MKKLSIILLLFSYFVASAQEEPNKQFYLGLNSGMITSRLNVTTDFKEIINPFTDQHFESAYGGGIVFIYYSEPRKGLQFEVNYSSRGWSETPDSESSYRRRLDYLEFPFLAHFDAGTKKIHLSVTAGPTISYLISSTEIVNVNNDLMKTYYNLPVDNRLEGGIALGIGLNTFTKIGIFQLECRINHGLSDLFAEVGDLGYSKAQNQVIGLKFSYLYGL
ncbi:MAG: PorT family protein [Bacteroidales bacterium]|nr:PorT family protein [Bacteroidales bacterium]